jgi:hypothetical protein
MSKSKPAQAEARKSFPAARRALARVRNLLVGGLCLYGLLLWLPSMGGYKMLLPINMTIASASDDGAKYGVETMSLFALEHHRKLYKAVDPLGLLWQEIPGVHLAHSWNNYHLGVHLVLSPDGQKLFVKRGMKRNETIWSDCLDLASEPIRSCGRVPDCCTTPPDRWTTDRYQMKQHSQKVEAVARAAGIVER